MTHQAWQYVTAFAGEDLSTGDYCYVDADGLAWKIRSDTDVFVGAVVHAARAREAVHLVSPDLSTFLQWLSTQKAVAP